MGLASGVRVLSAGGVLSGAASSWTPSTLPRTSTRSTPVLSPFRMVTVIASPRA